MPAKGFKIEGARELDAVLKRLPDKISEKVLVAAVRAGATVVAKDMKRRVRVRFGKLRDSIVVRKAPRKKYGRRKGLVVIGFLKPTSRRAHLIEFGTRHSPAFPFIRPALAANGGEAIDTIGHKLARDVDRAAEKLAGRYATSGLRPGRRRRRRR